MSSGNSTTIIVPSESPSDVFTDRMWLRGALLAGVAYGVVLLLYPMCTRLLLKQMTRENRKHTIGLLVYITAMFTTGTLVIIACFAMTEIAFVENRNFPGGPGLYEEVMSALPINNMGNISLTVGMWLADGLMVWRCYVIYQSLRIPIWVTMAIPSLLWLATFISGCFLCAQLSTPTASIWVTSGINMTLPYLALSLTTNALTTIMILARLLSFRHNANKYLGSEHARTYTGIAALIVESAFIYFAFFVTMMASFINGNPVQDVFVQVLAEVQVIAPFLIIYRVAQGKAWSANITADSTRNADGRSVIRFNTSSAGGPLSSSGSRTATGADIESKLDVFPMDEYAQTGSAA